MLHDGLIWWIIIKFETDREVSVCILCRFKEPDGAVFYLEASGHHIYILVGIYLAAERGKCDWFNYSVYDQLGIVGSWNWSLGSNIYKPDGAVFLSRSKHWK